MLWGYNTNGLAHHDPFDAIELLADLGYQSVALTIDHHCLSPRSVDWQRQADRLRTLLDQKGMHSVVETGARYLLDRNVKHEPTLMSPTVDGRKRRIEFYRHAIAVAAALGSDCVSLWSGIARDSLSNDQGFARLVESLKPVVEEATRQNVKLGFEPEPGMFVDTMAKFDRLCELLPSPALCLTLDIGHLHCLGEIPLADYVRRYAPQLVNVHLEDMRAGTHEHLPFGEGTIDFFPVVAALAQHYEGGVHIELSRHSHEGPAQAARSIDYLQRIVPPPAV